MIFAYIKQKDKEKKKTEKADPLDELDKSIDGLSDTESDYSFFEPELVNKGKFIRQKTIVSQIDSDIDEEYGEMGRRGSI